MLGIISLWFKHPLKINPPSESTKESSNTTPVYDLKVRINDFEI